MRSSLFTVALRIASFSRPALAMPASSSQEPLCSIRRRSVSSPSWPLSATCQAVFASGLLLLGVLGCISTSSTVFCCAFSPNVIWMREPQYTLPGLCLSWSALAPAISCRSWMCPHAQYAVDGMPFGSTAYSRGHRDLPFGIRRDGSGEVAVDQRDDGNRLVVRGCAFRIRRLRARPRSSP